MEPRYEVVYRFVCLLEVGGSCDFFHFFFSSSFDFFLQLIISSLGIIRSNGAKERECLIEYYYYYKKLEIIVSPNAFLESSKRSNSIRKDFIERSIFVINFNAELSRSFFVFLFF